VDDITLLVFLGFWPVWLVWELVLLWLRSRPGEKPKTISMVARDRGHHLSSVAYLWGGLATHFWWPSEAWATVPGSVAFWVVALGLVVWDVDLWRMPVWAWPRWLVRVRAPLLWLILGGLAGRFLFPQRGISLL
jgi:hypothetical protein